AKGACCCVARKKPTALTASLRQQYPAATAAVHQPCGRLYAGNLAYGQAHPAALAHATVHPHHRHAAHPGQECVVYLEVGERDALSGRLSLCAHLLVLAAYARLLLDQLALPLGPLHLTLSQ